MIKVKKLLKDLFPYTKRNWSIFFLCVLISSIFWLFLTFSGYFDSTIKFKISYSDFPKNKVLINEPVSDMVVLVKAKGFELLKHSIFNIQNDINLNVDDFVLSKKGSVFYYHLPPSKKINLIKTKTANLLEILSIPNDTIKLVFDDVIRKKVPLKAIYHIENDSNFYKITKKIIYVDSVEIRGSKSLVSKTQCVETEDILVSHPKENTEIHLPVRRKNGVLEMFPDTIKLGIQLEAIKQFTMQVPLVCADCPPSVQLKLFPSSAKVIFNCSENEFKKIKGKAFKLRVHYDEVKSDSEKLFIHLIAYPSFVNNIKIAPAKADYLVREN